MRTALTATLALALLACDAGDGPLDVVDPAAIPEAPTWSAPVGQILDLYCAGCHAADALPGEKEGYAYDTCEKAKVDPEETLETIREGSMPPPTGYLLPTAAKITLERWYAQGAPCD